MKMTQEHFNQLKQCIDNVLIDHPTVASEYSKGNFPRSDKVKDINVRFRWDLYHFSGAHKACGNLYSYLNDDHIDTALRNIVPTIAKEY